MNEEKRTRQPLQLSKPLWDLLVREKRNVAIHIPPGITFSRNDLIEMILIHSLNLEDELPGSGYELSEEEKVRLKEVKRLLAKRSLATAWE